jgi:sorbitol-6-phosphate 2-dehydrogenase
MNKTLQDRIAIVTGGAQGLGAAICRRLADEGCHVVVADLNSEGAEQTAADIAAQTDRRTIAIKVDVTAGILIAEAIDEFPAEKWRAVMNVNLFGYFLCLKHAARAMKAQSSGAIVQINSKSGKKGSYKNSAYAASKFGGVGLTQSVALELAEYGVRVNAVCPGNLLDSPLWTQGPNALFKQYAKKWGITEEEVRQKYIDQAPMKRGCTTKDVCNVVVFLASDQAAYMTGQAVNVTGGQEMR